MQENRFDTLAGSWDNNPIRQAIARNTAQQIRKRLPLTQEMYGLDYGCGTGLVLLGLIAELKEMDGMDESFGMIEVLNEKFQQAHINNARAIQHNIEKQDLPAEKYDLITSGMALHHIKTPQMFFDKTYAALKAGGYLCVADLDSEDGSFHPEQITDYFHNGFDRQEIEKDMQQAGFRGIQIATCYTVEKQAKQYPIFLAIGQK